MEPVHTDPEEHSVAERKWPCGYSNLPTPWELLASATSGKCYLVPLLLSAGLLWRIPRQRSGRNRVGEPVSQPSCSFACMIG